MLILKENHPKKFMKTKQLELSSRNTTFQAPILSQEAVF
jgi:hypothetical protein